MSRTAFVPVRYHAAISVIRRRQSEGNCGGTENTDDGKPRQIHEDDAAKALHRETTLAWSDCPGK